MPNRGKHQAAGNGIPRRNPLLFSSASQFVTLDDWRAALLTVPSAREVNRIAGLIAEMVPNEAGDAGLQKLNLLLRSTILTEFREAIMQLPPELRPIKSLRKRSAIALALMIAH